MYSKLRFDRHLKKIQEKALKGINIMRLLCRISWGMETSTALGVYKSYVRSILEYAIFVYYPREGNGRETLEKI